MDFLRSKRYHILKGSAFKAFSFLYNKCLFHRKVPYYIIWKCSPFSKEHVFINYEGFLGVLHCIRCQESKTRLSPTLTVDAGHKWAIPARPHTHLPWVPLGSSAVIGLLEYYLRWFWRVSEKLRLIFGWVPGLIIANYKFLSGHNLKNRA